MFFLRRLYIHFVYYAQTTFLPTPARAVAYATDGPLEQAQCEFELAESKGVFLRPHISVLLQDLRRTNLGSDRNGLGGILYLR